MKRHWPNRPKDPSRRVVGRWCVFASDPYPPLATFTPNASTGRPSGSGLGFGWRLGRGSWVVGPDSLSWMTVVAANPRAINFTIAVARFWPTRLEHSPLSD